MLATRDLVVGYPDGEPLFSCPDVEIRRGQRVALLGPNGAGKTTFLKTILGQVEPKAGAIRFGAGVEVGYFAQTQASLNLAATVLDEILTIENMPIGEETNEHSFKHVALAHDDFVELGEERSHEFALGLHQLADLLNICRHKDFPQS